MIASLASKPLPQEKAYDSAELERIYGAKPLSFSSESAMREWLSGHGVDLALADSREGLGKLFQRIEKGEARLVYDEGRKLVYRTARVAEIAVEATIHGERYPLVELCQIYLKNKISPEALQISDPEEIAPLLSSLEIRSAQVRNSMELWETLDRNEDSTKGARRGLVEELKLKEHEAQKAHLTMTQPRLVYEEPINWPGLHSVLEVNQGRALLPEEISKPAYVEIENGDKITIFVATPGAPLIRALLKKIIPNIHYVNPEMC